MDFSSIWRWLKSELPPPRYADQAVARQVYADYMRTQILGFNPTDADTLLARLSIEREGGAMETAAFPALMGVETRLAAELDDDMADQTYWIVRERFNRIASASAIEEHSRWSPSGLVEPAERVPLTGTPTPAKPSTDTDPASGSASADEIAADQAEPPVDTAAVAAEADVREAEQRHEQSVDIAAAGKDSPAPTAPVPAPTQESQ